MKSRKTRLTLTACLLGPALAIAGCSTSSSGSSSSGTTSTGVSSAAVEQSVAAATSALQTDTAAPGWTAPGPAINPAKLRGKSIFVIPISKSGYETQLEASEKQAAAAAGVKLTFYPNQGDVAAWQQGMDTAIADKPNLIFLEAAPDPRQLQPQLAAAKKAGIPVLASHIWGTADPNPSACIGCTGVTAIVRGPFVQGGKAGADWVISNSGGHADVLIVSIDGINADTEMLNSALAEYKAQCPGCKVKVVSLTLTQISTGAITAVSTALTADPHIDYVNPMFDLLIPGTIASMQASNHVSGTKVFSFNGTSAGLADVANPNSPMAMDVAEPLAWTAYANMDQAFRLLAGMAPVNDYDPIRVFTKANIGQAGGPPNYSAGFGTAYTTGYFKLWGLQPPS